MSEQGRRAELETVSAAMRGDPDSLRALWQRHRSWIAAVVLANKPAEADLEDLLQEVAMAYVSRIGTLRDPEAFGAWLRTTALNIARAEGRGRTRRRRLDARRPPPERAAGPAADEPLAWREGRGQIEQALAELSADYREPLILRCLRGMSYRQIGEAMGLPETTVETRIARARRQVREALARQEGAAREAPSEGSARGQQR